MAIRIEPLSHKNFDDYVALTRHGDDGAPCYCAFWHCASHSAYTAMKQQPESLCSFMRQRIDAGFVPGVLAYDDEALVAWVSIARLNTVQWAWKRVAALGEIAGNIAAITCFTLAESARKQGYQRRVAVELLAYGRSEGWSAIEAYPFDDAVFAAHPEASWSGFERPYLDAGFARTEAHWLSRPPEWTRWIVRAEL